MIYYNRHVSVLYFGLEAVPGIFIIFFALINRHGLLTVKQKSSICLSTALFVRE